MQRGISSHNKGHREGFPSGNVLITAVSSHQTQKGTGELTAKVSIFQR